MESLGQVLKREKLTEPDDWVLRNKAELGRLAEEHKNVNLKRQKEIEREIKTLINKTLNCKGIK